MVVVRPSREGPAAGAARLALVARDAMRGAERARGEDRNRSAPAGVLLEMVAVAVVTAVVRRRERVRWRGEDALRGWERRSPVGR